jgi:hypothetical protein
MRKESVGLNERVNQFNENKIENFDVNAKSIISINNDHK